VLSSFGGIRHPNILQILHQSFVECDFALEVDVAIQLSQHCHCALDGLKAYFWQF
jgi:hypothetical protein